MRTREPGIALAVICTLVGIAAVLGGHALVAWPDGSAIGLPLAVLEHSPFSDFTIPGLLLVFVIGFSNLLAAVLVLVGSRHATAAAGFAGVALLDWIVTQMLMLRSANALQLGCLVAAIAIIALAARYGTRTMRPSTSPRLSRA